METIRAQQLSKSFGSSFRLGPLDLQVQAGEILGVMGPNAAGKTTLLRLIWGFLRPDHGSVSVFGLKPHLQQVQLRLRAGFMAENPQFYDSMTATSFLKFIAHFYENWDGQRVSVLFEQLRLQPDVRIRNLSKGNRVKLALVAAVGHRPSLLILDEPTSGLDPMVRVDILGFLRRLAKQEHVTILLSSHISDDLDQIADSVLMLNNGKAVEYAPTSDLLVRYNLTRLEAVFLNAIGTQHHS
jgi:ABC-2 type transport system ATP-binding protein